MCQDHTSENISQRLRNYWRVFRPWRAIIIAVIMAALVSPFIYLMAGPVMGLVLGIIIGLGCAGVFEFLDSTVSSIKEIEQLSKLPVLGVIPDLSVPGGAAKDLWTSLNEMLLDTFYTPFFRNAQTDDSDRDALFSLAGKDTPEIGRIRALLIWNYNQISPFLESYRILRANLIKSVSGNKPPDDINRIIAITSSGAQDGKTITACNLAITMALQGDNVLLVDMDMRESIIHKIFGLERENGLSDVLVGIKKLDECVHHRADLLVGGNRFNDLANTPVPGNLHIITAGTAVPKPNEVLARGLDSFFSQIRPRYQYIICDCPPVFPVADILAFGRKVDMTALVYRSGKTAKGALLRAKEQMPASRIKLIGLIANQTVS